MTLLAAVWLNESECCSIEHLVEVSGLSLAEVESLVDDGVMEPADAPTRSFHLIHVATVRQARRLRDDFELDRNGLTLAMTLLRRIDTLEQTLRAARAEPLFDAPATGETR